MTTTHLPVVSDSDGLQRYFAEIRKFPMLEPHEEQRLASAWQNEGDREAAHKLVTSHLRLVAKIAMGYRGYGLPIGDVIAEGNVGLMQAVKRFNPDKGFRLATYAMWWIKASIQEYVLRSWSLVKLGTTANQKKLFFNLRRVKNQISALDDGDLNPDQVTTIANKLSVNEKDVIEMNQRMSGDLSLSAPIKGETETSWQDWLVDNEASQEDVLADEQELDQRRQMLTSALGVLKEREKAIFIARRLAEPVETLDELSQQYSVSRERIRQIENRAFEKVSQFVRDQAQANGLTIGDNALIEA